MESTWLTEEEQNVWRTYLRTSALLSDLMDRDMQQHGVSLNEYEILAMLSEATGRHLRMSAIADLVVQSRSRLTHTAARLERRGWVRRRPADDDRRGVELCLTESGYAAVDALAPLHVASVRRHLLDPLSAQQYAELGHIMALLRAANADGS